MRLLLLASVMALSGCITSSDTSDLKQFVDSVLSQPRGRIEPIPVFKPHEFFNYSAAGVRSPFELPIVVDTEVVLQERGNDIAPDPNRAKEHLEQFAFGQLSMVGTMRGVDQTLWGLVKDGSGSVVRVKVGNYMGQNHGKIMSLSDYQISLIEIVPDGLGGWIERPRIMALDGVDEG